ncbi:MAG: tetratricopeptide repeat protein, partial [Proteobacteria bacterium]|nr:tetratricopeptide repeat protein [Pseudomonadota bacterium]
MDLICREKLEFANKLIFVRRYEDAERFLQECLMLPGCALEPLVHLRKIELMSLLGRLPEISGYYARHSSDAKQPSMRLFAIIAELFGQNTSAESTAQLQSYLKLNGPSCLAYFALGYASEQAGLADRARSCYEQSITLDPDWYPSLFGLSQVHYILGDDRKGDECFHQFEAMAPFNVYGNFETHRRLSNEFFALGRFEDAERAIQMLTSWWVDNKGYAPAEIQAYENLATSKISIAKKDHELGRTRRATAVQLASDLIGSSTADENILYFLANILEEFGEEKLAFQAYKKVLQVAGESPSVVQKVGSHFLGQGQYDAALELFEHAYDVYPDNPEIRFCLLVARLKKAGVPVEEYLIGRERIRQLVDSGDRVELLGLLTGLMQKFSGDWDVHFHLAEMFLRIGHHGKAGSHYDRMFELDPKGQHSRLRYANFLMTHNEAEKAMAILNSITLSKGRLSEIESEIQWLKASYFDLKMQWTECGDALRPLLDRDPWNITYMIQEIVNLTGLKDGSAMVKEALTTWIQKLTGGDETKVNWAQFSKETEKLSEEHCYGLAYARSKLQFLYMRGNELALKAVVSSACAHDAAKGARDLLRLLNTNFDSPAIYWGLGLLYKELWQLEVASMWFEHTLQLTGVDDKIKSQIYVDLADTYIWRNMDLPKAVEYCRLTLDLGDR